MTAELVLRSLVGNPEDGPLETQDDRVLVALRYAVTYGQTDGDRHKAWVIDQMVRSLLGDDYESFVDRYSEGDDGPETYHWEEGVAP
jgi:hypothetical protein